MKLRTKLVIVFLAVMLLTAFFTTVAMHTFALRSERDPAALSARGHYHYGAAHLLDLPDDLGAAGEASEGSPQYQGGQSGL